MRRRQHASKERADRDRKLLESLERLSAERVAAGVCRHCGGAVPCWSAFGDAAVGVAHGPRNASRTIRRPLSPATE